MIETDRETESLTNFKRKTTQFLQQLKETGEPIVLTVNGKAELVVQDAAAYQKLMELKEQWETIQAIQEGLEDMRAGRTRPASEFFAEMEREFGIAPEP
jgi:prevent-host-death family protein